MTRCRQQYSHSCTELRKSLKNIVMQDPGRASQSNYETAGKNFFGHMGRWGKISLPLTLTMKVRLTLGGYPFLATQVYFPLSCS